MEGARSPAPAETPSLDSTTLLSSLWDSKAPIGAQLEADLTDYLTSITSSSLDKLTLEPDKQRQNLESVRASMKDLACRNYATILQNCKCVAYTYEKLDSVQKRLDKITATLPNLTAGLTTFLTAGQSTLAQSRGVRSAMRNLPTLLDVLEVPQLMGTCARCQAYDEALQLDAMARRALAANPGSAVLRCVGREADGQRAAMQRRLEGALRGASQLPVIVRSVGLLRRLDAYSPHELRLAFLVCRDAALADAVAAIPDLQPLPFTSKMTDVVRTHVFDIVTQYKAIFGDDASAADQAGSLLTSWMVAKVDWFLNTLERNLQKINEGSSIASLLDQCMYTGQSLGRVGLDLRGLVAPVFTARIACMFDTSLASAAAQFRSALASYRFLRSPWASATSPPPSPLRPLSPQSPAIASSARAPPMRLLDYPPLAVLTNGVLTALNELRQCAPASLKGELGQCLAHRLLGCLDELATAAAAADPADKDGVAAIAEAACEDMLPFLCRCYDAVFKSPTAVVSCSALAKTVSHLYRKKEPPAQPPSPQRSGTSKQEAKDAKEATAGAVDSHTPKQEEVREQQQPQEHKSEGEAESSSASKEQALPEVPPEAGGAKATSPAPGQDKGEEKPVEPSAADHADNTVADAQSGGGQEDCRVPEPSEPKELAGAEGSTAVAQAEPRVSELEGGNAQAPSESAVSEPLAHLEQKSSDAAAQGASQAEPAELSEAQVSHPAAPGAAADRAEQEPTGDAASDTHAELQSGAEREVAAPSTEVAGAQAEEPATAEAPMGSRSEGDNAQPVEGAGSEPAVSAEQQGAEHEGAKGDPKEDITEHPAGEPAVSEAPSDSGRGEHTDPVGELSEVGERAATEAPSDSSQSVVAEPEAAAAHTEQHTSTDPEGAQPQEHREDAAVQALPQSEEGGSADVQSPQAQGSESGAEQVRDEVGGALPLDRTEQAGEQSSQAPERCADAESQNPEPEATGEAAAAPQEPQGADAGTGQEREAEGAAEQPPSAGEQCTEAVHTEAPGDTGADEHEAQHGGQEACAEPLHLQQPEEGLAPPADEPQPRESTPDRAESCAQQQEAAEPAEQREPQESADQAEQMEEHAAAGGAEAQQGRCSSPEHEGEQQALHSEEDGAAAQQAAEAAGHVAPQESAEQAQQQQQQQEHAAAAVAEAEALQEPQSSPEHQEEHQQQQGPAEASAGEGEEAPRPEDAQPEAAAEAAAETGGQPLAQSTGTEEAEGAAEQTLQQGVSGGEAEAGGNQ
eukprot:m51a1_g8562 Conserved oligomeric Golgi complex subunit 8 (1256) ;mRNA; f:176262-180725